MIAVQLFAMVAIPITELLIIRPSNDYFLHTMFRNITLWLDINCCSFLSAASLSTTKKEDVLQSKTLWDNKIIHLVLIVATLGLLITLLALYELMLIMQVLIETGVKGSSARSAPILSTVCTWMVLEK